MLTDSSDRGRTWTPKRPLTEGTRGSDFFYNCPRISKLPDGRIVIVVDRVYTKCQEDRTKTAKVVMYFSDDNGNTWSSAAETPMRGIVPDKLLVLKNNRWILSAHHNEDGKLAQYLRFSDNQGITWSDPVVVAKSPDFNLCEASILPLDNGALAAFMRENSGMGYDCKKTISRDNGETWGPVIDFPLPGCHRPVSGMLSDGKIMITYRFMQGGKGWLGFWTQNFFAALTDQDSVLAETRNESAVRIMPVDFDRSPNSDLGYSGWVQFPDGEIYVVNYIVDDAFDKAQIRGYSMHTEDFIIQQ